MLIKLNGWKNLTNNKALSNLNNKLIKIKKGINKSSNEFSFLRSDNNKEIFNHLKKYKKKFKKIDSFLLIGTGGSSLGAKAIINLYDKKKINFIENLDPTTLKNFFNVVGSRFSIKLIFFLSFKLIIALAPRLEPPVPINKKLSIFLNFFLYFLR